MAIKSMMFRQSKQNFFFSGELRNRLTSCNEQTNKNIDYYAKVNNDAKLSVHVAHVGQNDCGSRGSTKYSK